MARDSVVKIKNRSRDYYCTLDHVICNLLATSFPGSSLFLPRLEGEWGGGGGGTGTGRGAVSLALPLPPATAMQANGILSNEGLMFVTSAFESLYGGQFTFSYQLC